MSCLLAYLVAISTPCRPYRTLLTAEARKFDHVTPLLRDRHSLPVQQRVTFETAVIMYKCVHGMTADYLADYIRQPSSSAADMRLRSAPVACSCPGPDPDAGIS